MKKYIYLVSYYYGYSSEVNGFKGCEFTVNKKITKLSEIKKEIQKTIKDDDLYFEVIGFQLLRIIK